MLKTKSFSTQDERSHIDSDKQLLTQKSQLDLAFNTNPIFGIVAKVIVETRIKCKGFLTVSVGDSVTLLKAPPKSGIIYCQWVNEFGNIPAHVIKINRHSWNFYLRIVDVLMENPKILEAFLYKISDDTINLLNFIKISMAKQLLPDILIKLLKLEYSEKIEKGLNTELFRSSSPPMILLGSLFSSCEVSTFCTMIVKNAISFVNKPCYDKSNVLLKVLNRFMNFILSIPYDIIPYEIVLSLQCVMRATDGNSIILGSIFFLRLICPALTRIQDKSLITLAKCIQLIANHVDPAPDHFMYKIKDHMQNYQKPISTFLTKIALTNLLIIPIPDEDLIGAAAIIYKEVTSILTSSFDHDIILHELKQKLGPVPTNENPIPLIGEIEKFKNEFSHLVQQKISL